MYSTVNFTVSCEWLKHRERVTILSPIKSSHMWVTCEIRLGIDMDSIWYIKLISISGWKKWYRYIKPPKLQYIDISVRGSMRQALSHSLGKKWGFVTPNLGFEPKLEHTVGAKPTLSTTTQRWILYVKSFLFLYMYRNSNPARAFQATLWGKNGFCRAWDSNLRSHRPWLPRLHPAPLYNAGVCVW